MRTLFLTFHSVNPPTGGAALRNLQNINCVKQYGEVGIFYLHTETPLNGDSPLQKPPGVDFWRVFSLTANPILKRLLNRLKILIGLLTNLEFLLADGYYHPDAVACLEQMLQEYQPDVVVFAELWMYSYLPVVRRYPCKIVYDAHNFETELIQQIASQERLKGWREAFEITVKVKLVAKVEQLMLASCHQLWACSDTDRLKLVRSTPHQVSSFTIPNGVNLENYKTINSSLETALPSLKQSPHTLIFTASFGYMPNVTAAHWLITDIFPQLQGLYPDCQLLLVGSNPPAFLLDAAQVNSAIVVTGRVPDVYPYLAAASVVVVPLLEGGGTRLKIVEAFAAMRPVVSTSKGAEGLAVEDGKHLLIRETSQAIAQGISDLWQSPQLAQELVVNAKAIVESSYSWQSTAKSMKYALQELESGCAIADLSYVS
jgi:polysaccharide biosynthesis protein PslH